MMIKDYWKQLSTRERQLLILTGVVVMITLFYFSLWQPLQDGIDNNRKRLQAQSNQLQLIQQQAAEAQQLSGSGKRRQGRVTDSSSMLAIIERTANQKKIKTALQKIQPEGQDGVRLWLEDIAFDQLIDWLSLLDTQHGIYVSDISLQRDDKPGRVDGRLLLRTTS